MGSNPILSGDEKCKLIRVSVNGKRFAFQAETVGSIPTTRMTKNDLNATNPTNAKKKP